MPTPKRKSEVPQRKSQDVGEIEAAETAEDFGDEIEVVGNVDRDMLIPTGSTMLNLALSDDPYGGFALGTINNIIGDSAAGKTVLLMSVFAGMAYDERFDEHELFYDEPEAAYSFNTEKLFGEEVVKRVDDSIVSETVEDWHDNVLNKAKTGKPFAYGLDSMDAISSDDEINADVRKGTYGASKPKLIGQVLRKIATKIKNGNSVVFVISQTRDAIGVMFGDKKTRSGGKALKFFSTHEMWMAVKEHLKRKGLDVGVLVRVKVSKNKLTGKLRIVEFPIYYDYGIDDISSCIDFLMSEGRWKTGKKEAEEKVPVKKSSIVRTAAKVGKETEEKKKNEDKLIDTKGEFSKQPIVYSELRSLIANDKNLYHKLVSITTEVWREREAEVTTNLPPKFSRE
jgi:recombination protein RecA